MVAGISAYQYAGSWQISLASAVDLGKRRSSLGVDGNLECSPPASC